MRWVYILFLSFVFASSLTAQQEFAPAGATWYYGYVDYAMGAPLLEGYEEVIYSRDTLIADRNCKVLSRRRVGERKEEMITYPIAERILYQEGRKVFQYFPQGFGKIYDFGVAFGDTLSLFLPTGEALTFQVDSIFYGYLDEVRLKNIRLRELTGAYTGHYWINERLGGIPNDLHRSSVAPQTAMGEAHTFRCYEDDEFAHYQHDTIACDEYTNLSQIISLTQTGISIPHHNFQDKLTLSNRSGEAYDLAVFDFQGKLMEQAFAITEGYQQINCSDWPTGTYVVQLKLGDQRSYQKVEKR